MRRNHWLLFLLAAVLAGLTGLTACGGGSGGNGGGGGGGGTNPPLTGLTIYPGANGTTVSVAAGSTVQFTAYQADALVSVNWTASGGTITGNGTSSGAFTAPTAQGSVTVSAVSTSSTTTGGSVTVNVTAPSASGILVNPGATVVAAGGTTAFSATLNGGAVSPAPTWQVNGTNGGDGVHGTIDANGNYTAPLTPPPGGSTTITAVSGGNSATASVTVVYSNLSFSGPYAFSYTGNDGNGFLTVAGSFVADGSSGSITSGEEDYVDSAVLTSPATFGGTFAVGPDGRGSLTISSNAPDSTGVIQFSLTNGQQGGPAQHAVLIRLDTLATGSGTIDAQNPLDLAAGFSGNYIFGSSGLDNILSGSPLNLAGKFFVDGSTLTLPVLDAEQDFNYGGTSTSATNGGPDLTLYGSFTMDADASTTGRGTLLLNTTNTFLTTTFGETPLPFQYTFYIVDSSHLKIVESDTNFIMSGDIFGETSGAGPYTAANLLPSSNYAFTTGGSSNAGPFAAGGVFVSGGGTGTATSGSITGGVYDNNDAGTTKLDETITAASFSIDTFGRINLSLDPGATYSYAGYAGTYNSANGPVNVVEMIDLEQNFIDSGLAYRQTSGSTPSGSYALNMTGAANNSGTEQDFEGQFGIGNTGTITGNLDINNAEVNGIQANVPFTSSSITTVGTDGRGTPLTLHTSSPTTNYPLAYYVIDDNTSLVFETDGVRVLTGIIQKQY